MPKRVISVRCPTCRKIVLQKEPDFPFCSQRCRLIDLGKWASGGYVISTPIAEADQSGEADYASRSVDRGREAQVSPTNPAQEKKPGKERL